MAVPSIGTATNAWGFSTGHGAGTVVTFGGHTYHTDYCLVSVNFNDQTFAYDGAFGSVFDPTPVVQRIRKDGKTVVALQACSVEGGIELGHALMAGRCTCVAGEVYCHLYLNDLATEKTDGAWAAPSTWAKDVVFSIMFGVLDE